jgi:ferredoxin
MANKTGRTRDNQKCILCGQCIEVCQNIQSVYRHYQLPLKNTIVCVNCGQCRQWCPSGAITEVDEIDKVLKAIADPDLQVVVQTAPATRVGRVQKMEIYRKYAVPHYWIADPDANTLEAFALKDGYYVLIVAGGPGDAFIHPDFPGLSLDLEKIFQDIN